MTTKRQLERTLDYYRKNALSLAIELDAVRVQHDAYKAKMEDLLARLVGTSFSCGAHFERGVREKFEKEMQQICSLKEQIINLVKGD